MFENSESQSPHFPKDCSPKLYGLKKFLDSNPAHHQQKSIIFHFFIKPQNWNLLDTLSDGGAD